MATRGDFDGFYDAGEGGLEATRRIKQLLALKTVFVIAISASAFKYYQQKNLEAGYDDFIAKQIHIETLLFYKSIWI